VLIGLFYYHFIYILAILFQTLCGLSYLHEQNKIHRDIKSGNLLLTSKGELKIADFGTSAEGDNRTTVIGSQFWMAPETIDSRGHGPPADMWSLGVTLMEMAQKDPPNWHLRNQGPSKVANAILHGPPPALTDPTKWSAQFVEICARCCKKEPTQRPSSTQLLKHPAISVYCNRANEALLPLVNDVLKKKTEKKSQLHKIIKREPPQKKCRSLN